jgi:hypothetical protein
MNIGQVRQAIRGLSNPEGINQYTKGGGGSGAKEKEKARIKDVNDAYTRQKLAENAQRSQDQLTHANTLVSQHTKDGVSARGDKVEHVGQWSNVSPNASLTGSNHASFSDSKVSGLSHTYAKEGSDWVHKSSSLSSDPATGHAISYNFPHGPGGRASNEIPGTGKVSPKLASHLTKVTDKFVQDRKNRLSGEMSDIARRLK